MNEFIFLYLYENATIKPKVLQNRFYSNSGYDVNLRNFCKRKGITYQSFWSLTANPQILASRKIEELTKKYQKTIPQIFYRFLNQINITPLNGTTSKEHMLLDMDIDSFTLDENEVESINNLLLNS